jgi:hypothetical protein
MNRFILDDANRWIFPHVITSYTNLFYIDLFGAEASRSVAAPGSNRLMAGADPLGAFDVAETVPVQNTAGGGALFRVVDGLALGLHLSDYENDVVPRFVELIGQSSQGSPSAFPWLAEPPPGPAAANRKLDVFVAYDYEELLQLGLLLTYGSSGYSFSPDDNVADPPIDQNGNLEDRTQDEIGTSELGFLLSGAVNLSGTAVIEAGLGLTFHGLTYEPNQRDDLLIGGGGTEFRLDVRSRIGLTDWWELVPALSLRTLNLYGADEGSFSTGLVYNDEDGRENYFITDVDAGQTIFDLGVAGHLKPMDAVDFWVAAGIQYSSVFSQYRNQIDDAPDQGEVRDQPLELSREDTSSLTLPYIRLALEAEVFEWLDFRAGLVKFIRDETRSVEAEDDDDGANDRDRSTTTDAPFFDYFIGLAAHHAGFFVDLQIDPRWFASGPEFLSGAGSGRDMMVNVSLGYSF